MTSWDIRLSSYENAGLLIKGSILMNRKYLKKKEKSHKDTENTNFSSSFFENKLKVKCHEEHVKD